MDGDVEYQRLETSRFTNLWENKYWVLSVFVLIFDIMFFLAAFTGLFLAIVDGTTPWGFLLVLLSNFIGIFLLLNGIFGATRRKMSLTVYVCLFQLVPLLANAIILVACFFIWDILKKEAKEAFPESDPATMTVYAIGMVMICTAYHAGAAWIVNKFKQTQVQEQPDF